MTVTKRDIAMPIKTDNRHKAAASASLFGRTIAIGYVMAAIVAIMLAMDINTPWTPNAAGP